MNTDINALKNIISSQLIAARILRELSIRKAAQKIGISSTYLYQIENGKRNISLEILFAASKAYKVSIDALLGREDIPGQPRGSRTLDIIKQIFTNHSPQCIN